jgi:hypothetical protein
MTLLATNDDTEPVVIGYPFELFEQAGYNAFYADTLKKQNSIKRYFKKGELLCTFNDRARYEKYHIVHAVKNDVDDIRREAFKGKEQRQDDYGTSVISIQMLKEGGFISIKNRYNHSVSGCDHTFESNPDNIVMGLSVSLRKHFNVDFVASESPPPYGFVVMGEQVFKYQQEQENIYYGDQAWAMDGKVFTVNKSSGDALFDCFLFDNESKSLKNIDLTRKDSFAGDFNRYYGGNSGLTIHKGNLILDGAVLIGAENSQIKTLSLPALTIMGADCFCHAESLTHLSVPALTTMGDGCLSFARSLTYSNVLVLKNTLTTPVNLYSVCLL